MFENVDGRTDGRTDDGRRTDAGVTGILIAHLGAFGSGELKIRTKRLMENAFVKIAIYFFLPNAMMFTNKCHLCKITEFYKDQACPNHRQSFQICRLLPPYLLSLAIRLGLFRELF